LSQAKPTLFRSKVDISGHFSGFSPRFLPPRAMNEAAARDQRAEHRHFSRRIDPFGVGGQAESKRGRPDTFGAHHDPAMMRPLIAG